jgi:hypothetical protein
MGGMGADERVKIYMIGVIVQTGEVVYDEFEAGHLRTELDVGELSLNSEIWCWSFSLVADPLIASYPVRDPTASKASQQTDGEVCKILCW